MASTQILYIECSIPAGVTVADYRRTRPQPRTLRGRLRAILSASPSGS